MPGCGPKALAAPRSSKPACGSAFCDPSRVLPRCALNPRPAVMANSARNASAATIHGSGFVLVSRVAAAPPTGAPQPWQNFVPGLSSAEHEAQVVPNSGEPQLAQKRPLAAAPQEGQVVEEAFEGSDVISLKLHRRRPQRSAPRQRFPGVRRGRASPDTWEAASSRLPRSAPARRRLCAPRPSCPRPPT